MAKDAKMERERLKKYRTIPVYKETWKKLKVLSINEEVPLTELIERMLDVYLKTKQSTHSRSK